MVRQLQAVCNAPALIEGDEHRVDVTGVFVGAAQYAQELTHDAIAVGLPIAASCAHQ